MKEGDVLFNDALNTFYLRLYGVRHMVDDHSHSNKRNTLPPHGLLFPISSKGYFICIIPQAFVTPVMEHWLERELLYYEVLDRFKYNSIFRKISNRTPLQNCNLTLIPIQP